MDAHDTDISGSKTRMVAEAGYSTPCTETTTASRNHTHHLPRICLCG